MSLAVIFDCDGTLICNKVYHKNSWLEACRRHGHPLTEQDYYTSVHARTNDIIVKNLFGAGVAPSFGQALALEKEQIYRCSYKPFVAPIAGLLDFLKDLAGNSIPAAIASNSPMPNIDLVLDELGIRKYFSQIISSDDVTKGKPDPQVFLLAAQKMGVPIQDCVIFEDAPTGFEAARRAKAPFISITADHDMAHTTDHPGQLASFRDYSSLSVSHLKQMLAK